MCLKSVIKLFIIALVGSFSTTVLAIELQVAPDAKEGNPGTILAPMTFDAAIAKASEILKRDGLPSEGLTIILQGGVYPLTTAKVLNKEFRGSDRQPIIIKAAEGAEVTFDGRVNIRNPLDFSPVTQTQEVERLAKGAADKIRVITLEDPSIIKMLSEKLMLSLNFDEDGYLPALFPNRGYAKLSTTPLKEEVTPPGVPKDEMGYGVRAAHKPYIEPNREQGWMGNLEEPRGAFATISEGADKMGGTWQQWENELALNNTRNAMVGYYEAVWKLSSIPICAIDADKKSLHISRVFAYGFGWLGEERGGQPFQIFGLLSELDQPGEWFFDPQDNRLFVYPPKPITANSKIGLPVADGFITLNNTEHVQIIGLNVCNVGTGTIYDIKGGSNNLVAGCSIHSSTARGMSISGESNGVLACNFYDLNSHVSLNGITTAHVSTYTNSDTRHVENGVLLAGNNYVENCQFYQKNFVHEKINISMSGVGQVFKNNLVHNSIGQAMMIRGNDQVVELNEFFNIGYEEGDGGAIYSGGDITGYGNLYRHNLFHHLMRTPGKHGRAGIHLDDFQSGASCIGNIFYKSCTQGVYMNGGAGNTIIGNIFLEGLYGAYNRGNWGEKAFMQYNDIKSNPESKYAGLKDDYIGRAERLIGEQGWNRSPWIEKYPLFSKVMNEDCKYGRLWPIYCTFKDNIYYGNKLNRTNLYEYDEAVLKKTVLENDILVDQSTFVDYEHFNLAYAKCPEGVDPIPFDKIGLYLGKYRKSMPNKLHYRMAIKTFFKDDSSYKRDREIKQFNSATLIELGPKDRD